MPAVRTYRRKPSKRHQVQRTSLTLRRLMFVGALVGISIVCVWGYVLAPRVMAPLSKHFEQTMARLGFRLSDVIVEGRLRTDKGYILSLLELSRGKSLFSLNLLEAKAKLEKVSWIKEATLERKLPHTLFIRIKEKTPVSLWQHQGKTYLMDRDGDLVETKEPYKYKDFLVVTGEKAPKHIEELLALLSKVPEIEGRITGATYLRSGRWDLKFKGKVDIKLPEKEPERALAYLVALESKHHFINQDIMIIDMRIPGQLILRMTEQAMKKQRNKGKDA